MIVIVNLKKIWTLFWNPLCEVFIANVYSRADLDFLPLEYFDFYSTVSKNVDLEAEKTRALLHIKDRAVKYSPINSKNTQNLHVQNIQKSLHTLEVINELLLKITIQPFHEDWLHIYFKPTSHTYILLLNVSTMSEIHGDIQGNCEVRVKFPCGICFQG